MELFAGIVIMAIFTKSSILDVPLGSEYASGFSIKTGDF